VGETFCSQQRVGIVIPTVAAASRMVVPAGTWTLCPSIVRLTMKKHLDDISV
jgi:hypothetical protein